MPQVTSEYNYKRKSHRVDIPLYVEIDGKIFKTKDWSVTGVGILELGRDFESDSITPAKLILSMSDTTISINVNLCFRNTINNIWGFEFHEILPKHKRMLRHYIEMAVDGRIDNVEDMISTATAPAISSPIEDALNLTDIEQDKLTRAFKNNSRLTLIVSLLFVLSVMAMLFYNTTYRIRAIGIANGNAIPQFSKHTGFVDQIFVNTTQNVEVGAPLLSINQYENDYHRALLTKKLLSLRAQMPKLEQSDVEIDTDAILQNNLLKVLEGIEARQKKAFDLAKDMFEERIITKKDLDYLESMWRQALANLERERRQLKRMAAQLAQDKVKSARQFTEKALLEISDIEGQLAALELESQGNTVTANQAGEIYYIEPYKDAYVEKGDIVALIASEDTPYILTKVSNEEILSLKVGQQARVYIPSLAREVSATIESFGHEAIKSDFSKTNELSLEGTAVKLKLTNDFMLPPFTRVEVWIRTFDWF